MFKTKKAIKIRTIFMGSSSFSRDILDAMLKEKYNIISVYTKPDKKVGRNQELLSSPVKTLAKENDIPVMEIERFDLEAQENLKRQKPDLIVVVAYGKILPKEVLETPGFGSLNIHASLLPKFRGPSPVQNAILNGEKETGATLMLMNEGIDSGDILAQEKIKIGPSDFLPEIMGKLSIVSAKLVLEKVPLWIERKIKPQEQDESQASFCQLIERSDGKIFWNEDAQNIYNKFRAFYPWPGVFTYLEDESIKRIKLIKISLANKEVAPQPEFGKVFRSDEEIAVQTANGQIILKEIQLEGKKIMTIEDFVNGYPDFVGSILK